MPTKRVTKRVNNAERPQNKHLKPFTSKTGREGGKVGGKSRSERKAVANALKNRINCNNTCSLYPCPVQPVSADKYNGKCALKEQGKRFQDRVINIFTKGHDGLMTELKTIVADLSALSVVSDDDKTLQLDKKLKYFDRVIKYGEFAYGRKNKTEHSGSINSNELTADDLKDAVDRIHGKKGKDGVRRKAVKTGSD